MTKDEWYNQLFERLDNSKFRSSFHLKQKDIDYINEKGLDTIRQHAKDFIAKREAPAYLGQIKEKQNYDKSIIHLPRQDCGNAVKSVLYGAKWGRFLHL